MGFLSFLKTSDKALNTASDLVKSGAKGIDKLFFTSEEKSQASLDMIKLWIETQKVLRDENSAKSITRRILAVLIIAANAVLAFGAAIVYHFSQDHALFILELIKEYSWITASVVIFYFGYYAVKQIVGKK
jgi:hypothetical protein